MHINLDIVVGHQGILLAVQVYLEMCVWGIVTFKKFNDSLEVNNPVILILKDLQVR